jgi:predicted dehydrogenase
LLGPIDSVFGNLKCIHKNRFDPVSGEQRAVENEDIAQTLMKFDSGCSGSMEISRIATGRKCGLCFEISGSKGSLVFDQERMNEIRLYKVDEKADSRGFRTILSGPEHPDYAAFCPASGHGLGINDLKVIEVRNFLRSVASGEPVYSDFSNGYRVQYLVDAIENSDRNAGWVKTPQHSAQ